MNPIDLIPLAEPIPVHWVWLKVLLIFTFFLHIVLMNVMVGGAVISLFTRQQPQKELIGNIVSRNLPLLIPFTINFGVAPFLFLQVLYGNFIYVSSQLMAAYWVSLIILLMISYYAAYYYKFYYNRLQADSGKKWLGLIVLLFLLIGFLFSNNMTFMVSPETWHRYFDQARGTLLNLNDPTLAPRFLHFMLASVAVGGLFIAILGFFKRHKNQAEAQLLIHQGMKWFTYTTVIQVAVGCWFLISLPRPIMLLFMGGSSVHTYLFLISLVLTGLVILAGILYRVIMASVATALLVLLMIIMRDLLRSAYLAPYFTLKQLEITGQYSTLIMFLVSLALGLGVVAYLIHLAYQSNNNGHIKSLPH